MYIPIIKSRLGDVTALKHLTADVLSATYPLIQISDVGGDDCEKFIERINDSLAGKDASVYLDFSNFSDNYINNATAVLNGVDASIDKIPVINQNTSDNMFTLLSSLISSNGCCLRIKTEVGDNVLQTINATIDRFELNKDQIDLMLDCKYVNDNNLNEVSQFLTTLLPTIEMEDYRNVGVASGSFLTDLGGITADTIREFPRYEQNLYDQLTLLFGDLFYSDYGNQHPVAGESTPSFTPSCSIKYTGAESFVIFRGRQPGSQERGSLQYYDKSRQVVQHASYDGGGFSWGDGQIQEKADATRENRPGNATNWVSITLNRHITKLHSIIN